MHSRINHSHHELTLALVLMSLFSLAGCKKSGPSPNAPPPAHPKATVASTSGLSTVPFVGCPADGQQGPQPAPKHPVKPVTFNSSDVAKLALYEYNGEDATISALGPRGWHCFVTIGSSGVNLYIAPEALNANKVLMHKNWKGFAGPAIQISATDGDTSGRFEVARTVARVFPKYKNYVDDVIAEGIEPAKDFHFGPYPTDQLHYINDHSLDFTTPPNHEGLGTDTWLVKNDQPITGFVDFDASDDSDHDMTSAAVRLPADLRDLTPIILKSARNPNPYPLFPNPCFSVIYQTHAPKPAPDLTHP